MSILYQFLGHTGSENTIKKYSPAQSELLLCLSKRQVDNRIEELWTPLLGSVEQQIARFLSDALIEEASPEEKFDCKFRVADMKQLLESHSIPVPAKGKKSELVKKYLDTLPVETASIAVADVRLYHATPKGTEYIEMYNYEKAAGYRSMEVSAMASLMNGQINRAGERIALYESQQMFPRGAGIDWSKGMPEPFLKTAGYLLEHNYDDLPLSENQRKEVGMLLALSVLLGESYEQAGKRLLSLDNGEFAWAVFGNVLRTNPCCGFATSCDPDDPKAIAELYAHTHMTEASVNRDLRGPGVLAYR